VISAAAVGHKEFSRKRKMESMGIGRSWWLWKSRSCELHYLLELEGQRAIEATREGHR